MKKLIALLVVAAIVAAGLLLFEKRKADLTQASPAPILPAVVATRPLTIQPVILTLPTLGTVASDISTVLSYRLTRQVMAVYVQEGDAVKKGDVVARIDAGDLEAKKDGLRLTRHGIVFQVEAKRSEVQALEMSLKSAEEAHLRTKELLQVKGASAEQYSQEEAQIGEIKARLQAAKHSIETLQKNMESLAASERELDSLMKYATLISPIDGKVSQILARPGDLAAPGKPLIRIASRGGLYLNLSLPDTLRAAEVVVAGEALPLTSKGQAGETGLMQYVADLPTNLELVEGQFVNVRVVVYKGEDVLLPVDALLTMEGSSSVFVLAPDGKAQRVRVHIKARGVEGVTVTEDLNGRTVIVAKPDILLRVATGVPVVQHNL